MHESSGRTVGAVGAVAALAAMVLLGACGGSTKTASAPVVPATAPAVATTVPVTAHTHEPNAAPTKPLAVRADGTLDPAQIDLAGVDGVTPEEQANAADLLKRTINELPKWNDVAQAKADGFESIGDGLTGEEHYLHWDWIDDTDMLDPTHPEALVYHVDDNGGRTLEAAMYVLPKQYNLDNVPDVGGPLVQYHIHDDLCFTPPPAPKVAGITSVGGTCGAPLVKFNPNVMIHVWIRPNSCGPFAALQGVGAGQIKEGEARACDHVHGRLGL